MLYVFMGSSCSGKSSVAKELKKFIDVEFYTGKDYLRMSKNEYDAWKIFSEKLEEASNNMNLNSQSIVYIISERDDVSKIKGLHKAITVKFTADSDIIKSRFSQRMKGNLPKPVEKMIERQLTEWESINAKLYADTSEYKPNDVAKKIYDFTLNNCNNLEV
ncbi:hypothetical protein [Clostridium sp. KNHs214]|uniref:hypothetical protein n=1 Tax=Clostridium sp. KNHs214 TaxID=1540257 RepID=UPI00054FABA3|nr:hypothetical protein [Clostridium sp. KNHs214]